LRRDLSADRGLQDVLTKLYGGPRWSIFDAQRKPVSGPCKDNDLLMLGLPNEPLKHKISHEILHQPHHRVMTGSESYHTEEGGKIPSRLLFCEFFDNSIEALRRAKDAKRPAAGTEMPRIELYLIYQQGAYSYETMSHTHLKARVCAPRLRHPCLAAAPTPGRGTHAWPRRPRRLSGPRRPCFQLPPAGPLASG
jgi:hypothetical protein